MCTAHIFTNAIYPEEQADQPLAIDGHNIVGR